MSDDSTISNDLRIIHLSDLGAYSHLSGRIVHIFLYARSLCKYIFSFLFAYSHLCGRIVCILLNARAFMQVYILCCANVTFSVHCTKDVSPPPM